jgi:hypothetical protein
MSQLLGALAQSGDKYVQLGILILVGLSGFGNWIATWNSGDRNRAEIETSRRVAWEGQERLREEVRRQVNDIHQWLREATDEFHKGNEDSAQNRKVLKSFQGELQNFESRQIAALANQTKILQGQTQILTELHDFVQERKKLEGEHQ